MANRLEDYPIGIQVMFRQAGELLERLDRMEMDYRAWQASEAGRAWEAAQAEAAPCAATLLLLSTPSKAEQARLRWEARVRACLRVRASRAVAQGGEL